jgi:hypothetical protein
VARATGLAGLRGKFGLRICWPGSGDRQQSPGGRDGDYGSQDFQVHLLSPWCDIMALVGDSSRKRFDFNQDRRSKSRLLHHSIDGK